MVRIRFPSAASHTSFEGHRTQALIGCYQIASRLLINCSLRFQCRQGPPVRSEALDFHLLAADLVVHGLDVVAADLLEPDFFDHPRGLADQCLFGGLPDFDRGVCPIDIAGL